jgi:uncharacterized SAM-binding protein YcdF (DUF218 family)
VKSRRIVRFIWFGLSILGGIGLGLLAGWSLFPVQYANTSPASLRSDYKIDYVLMTAEIYKSDGDLPAAQGRLAELGEENITRLAQQAALDARDLGYDTRDLNKLVSLAQDLLAAEPTPIGDTP